MYLPPVQSVEMKAPLFMSYLLRGTAPQFTLSSFAEAGSFENVRLNCLSKSFQSERL